MSKYWVNINTYIPTSNFGGPSPYRSHPSPKFSGYTSRPISGVNTGSESTVMVLPSTAVFFHELTTAHKWWHRPTLLHTLCSYKMRKCGSAKMNMYKVRKFDAKDFAFYTSPFWVNLSHFRIIRKKREFINADPQSATTKPGLCYFVVI